MTPDKEGEGLKKVVEKVEETEKKRKKS